MTKKRSAIRLWWDKNQLLMTWLLIAILIIFPFVIKTGLVIRIATTVLIYCILTMGNMVITGHTGMLNMGHAAFYGVGAYISALLALQLHLPFAVCLLVAAAGAGLSGFLIAFPCLRVQTDFLSLITIAFSSIFVTIVTNWVTVTRGPMGLPGIPGAAIGGFQFNTPTRYYYLLVIMTILTYIVLRNILDSRIGRAMQATRDDEIGARSVGININRHKVLAFTIGTFFAGLAGSLMAHYVRFVGPSNFSFDESLLIMQMCIIGGLGSLPGAIVGAAFFTVMPEIIRPLAVYRVGIGGLIMILAMLFRPQGFFGSEAFAGKNSILDFFRQKKKGHRRLSGT